MTNTILSLFIDKFQLILKKPVPHPASFPRGTSWPGRPLEKRSCHWLTMTNRVASPHLKATPWENK